MKPKLTLLLLLFLPILTIAQPCKQAIHLDGAMAFGGPLKADSIFIDVDSVANITMSARVFVIEAGTTLWPLTTLELGGCTIEDAQTGTLILTHDSLAGPVDWWDEHNPYFNGTIESNYPVKDWYQTDSRSYPHWGGPATGGSYFDDFAKSFCWYGYQATAWINGVLHKSNRILPTCEGPPPNPR